MSEPLKKRILLVEDDAILAMDEKLQLEKHGYAVRTVTTGEQAVDAVETSSDIDLILMDINLGNGIDGTQAAEIILNDHDVPVVFLSSHTDPEIVEKTEKITSYGYVVKNSSVTVLDASIKMAFRLFDANTRLRNELIERERVEEAMREQRNFAESLIETTQTIILVLDSHGCIVRFNPYTAELLGYSLDEVKGLNWVETFVQPEDGDEVTAVLQNAIADDQTRGNVNLVIAKDGRTILVEWYNDALKDIDGHTVGVLATGTDITERRLAQRELLEKNSLLNEVLENMLDLVAITDMAGEFLYAGRSHEMLGYSPSSLIGRNVMDFVHPDDLGSVTQAFTDFLNTGNSPATEYRYRCADGSYVWLETAGRLLKNEHGKPSRILCNTRDITERKQHEKRLQASRQLNRALFDQAVSSMYITDLSGRYIDVNRTACSKSGYTREELLEMTVFDLNEPDSLRPGKEVLLDEWSRWEPGAQYAFESAYVRKDGTTYPVLISTGAIIYGETKAIAAAVMDITEQKRAEAAVQHLLNEKETLLKEIQHRIKNNINTMTSLLSLQAQTLEEPTAITALEDAGNRMNSLGVLYDHLYRADAIDKGSLQQYVDQLVVAETAVFPHGKRVQIHSELEEYMCATRTLSTLGLIVNELVTNAMKYAFRDHPSPELTLSGVHGGDHYTLAIHDNGPGIPTPDENQPSSGFGLMIVTALTEQLGGTIRFENDDGTHITLVFPISTDSLA